MKSSRAPDYSYGRFFVSPIVSCVARCSFCYIFSDGFDGPPKVNEYGCAPSISWIRQHEHFVPGRSGSIISIGAWGDPFPRERHELHDETLGWLRAACSCGCPVQIMSRFELPERVIDEIAKCEEFKHQILFSTSISTIEQWEAIEKGSDAPLSRLNTLRSFADRGIAVNVMIKPFLPGITDVETDGIADAILSAGVRYCVVGSLHWNDAILQSLNGVRTAGASELVVAARQEEHLQLLDCSTTGKMSSFPSPTLDTFIVNLQAKGLRVFKKSACVNSHLLQEKNAVLLYEQDIEKLCVKCGVCELRSQVGQALPDGRGSR